MAQQDPTGPNEAVLQGNPVSQIPADRAEGVLSLLKLTPHDQPSSMGDLISQHHQTRLANAQMYSNAAKMALHSQLMIKHGIDPESGQRFDDPSYKGPSAQDQAAKYQANYNEAWTNYKKLAGVDQNTKGALAKAEQILNHILGGGAMQSAPGAPSDQGRPGGMAPPPQAGLSGTAGGPSQVEAAAHAATPAITPPPKISDVSANPLAAPMIEANNQFEQGQQRLTAEQQRKFKTDVAQRTQEADLLQLPADSRLRAQYIATGTFPPVARLQKLAYKDPKTGKVKEGFADPIEGKIYDQNQNVVPDAEPVSLASMTPKKIVYKGPNGEPLIGLQVADKLYDQGGNELPEGTQAWEGTLVPKTTVTSSDKIDPLTGKRTVMGSSKTVAPSGTKITGPGGYKAGAGMSSPPTPQGGGTSAAPQGGGTSGGGKKSTPAAVQSPQSKLSGPTGTRASQDAEREAAYLHRNNLRNVTSSTRTMIEAAPKVENFVDKIQSQIDGLQNDLGPAKGRWNEFWAGKVGTKNPQYTALRTDVGLLSTLLMRMHVGARGGEYIMKHFEDLINQGKQDPDNLRAALKEIKDYADNVIQEGRQQGIDMAPGRAGGLNAPPAASGGFTPF